MPRPGYNEDPVVPTALISGSIPPGRIPGVPPGVSPALFIDPTVRRLPVRLAANDSTSAVVLVGKAEKLVHHAERLRSDELKVQWKS